MLLSTSRRFPVVGLRTSAGHAFFFSRSARCRPIPATQASGSLLPQEAAAITNAKFEGKGKAQFTPKKKQFNNPILDQPCPVHTKMDEEGNPIYAKHTTRQCRLLIEGFSERQPSEMDNEQDEEDKEDPFPQVHATLMIFADVESKSRLKLVNREVNMATPTNPKFLKWSQTAITFD
ncbi:hypothetical protein ZWY2020_055417 [Hordeum vulgare]|nr:hypothetical protein ZWY2020_055417 [Hordeum vulgare]